MRRQIAIILGITALVVVVVLVLGPKLVSVSTGTPQRANSIGVIPANSTTSPPVRELPAPAPMLAVEVVDSVTGYRIEWDASATLALGGGRWLDQRRGRFVGEPITFPEVPLGVPLLVRLRRPGYIETQVGPFVVPPGGTLSLRGEMTPLFSVKISPRLPEGDKHHPIRVFSETLPAWPEIRAYSEWQIPNDGTAGFMLPPGRYWLQVPGSDPLRHPQHQENGSWLDFERLKVVPGIPFLQPNFLFEFEVTDGPLKLEPEIVWPIGELSITGSLVGRNGKPRAGRRVQAIRCGPGLLREFAAAGYTDKDGRFELEHLMPGVYRINETYRATSDGEDSIWLGQLGSENPTPDITLASGGESAAPEPEAHDRPLEGVNIKLPRSSTTPTEPEEPTVLPPRPPDTNGAMPGRSVRFHPTGVATPELWSLLAHVREADGTRSVQVAEPLSRLRLSLLYEQGRVVILLEGLGVSASEVTLRLPGRAPVRVALVDEQAAYSVSFVE